MYVHRGLGQSVEEFTQRRMRAEWAEAEGRDDPYESEEAVWGTYESQASSDLGPQIQPESPPPLPPPTQGPIYSPTEVFPGPDTGKGGGTGDPPDVFPGAPIVVFTPEEEAVVSYQPTGTMFLTAGNGRDPGSLENGAEDGAVSYMPAPYIAPEPVYTPPAPADTSVSGELVAQEDVGSVSNGVDVGPGAEDASSTSTDPVGSGELVTITVQLRNAGNFNPPGANTLLRFTMPGLGGSICATGAAFGQLPPGSRANTFILGQWQLTGQWGGGGNGCTFVVHSARETVAGYVEAISIPPQETPYTPGPDYCPPGQIPKPDGSGCYEPCPERSQRYDEATGSCVPIECPPGTIVGAYGECVTIEETDAGPIGVPYVEPEPEVLAVPSGIDPLLHCAPGWWAPEGVCVPTPMEPRDVTGEERIREEERRVFEEFGPAEYLNGNGDGDDWKYPTFDGPGEEWRYPTDEPDPSDEDPWGEWGAAGEPEPRVVEPLYQPTPEDRQYDPAAGPVVEAGPSAGGGAGPVRGAPADRLVPIDPGAGAPGDGFGIVGVAIAAGLAWILAESYRRA